LPPHSISTVLVLNIYRPFTPQAGCRRVHLNGRLAGLLRSGR
jgi:hypothetical protein